jgi:hypothetical protein
MGWIGTPDDDDYMEPVHVDPWPFTKAGREHQRREHELRLEQARLKVDRLQARKREIQTKLNRARSRSSRGLPPR